MKKIKLSDIKPHLDKDSTVDRIIVARHGLRVVVFIVFSPVTPVKSIRNQTSKLKAYSQIPD